MMNGTLFSPTSSPTLESPLLKDGQTLMHQFCIQEQQKKAFTVLDQKRIQQQSSCILPQQNMEHNLHMNLRSEKSSWGNKSD